MFGCNKLVVNPPSVPVHIHPSIRQKPYTLPSEQRPLLGRAAYAKGTGQPTIPSHHPVTGHGSIHAGRHAAAHLSSPPRLTCQ